EIEVATAAVEPEPTDTAVAADVEDDRRAQVARSTPAQVARQLQHDVLEVFRVRELLALDPDVRILTAYLDRLGLVPLRRLWLLHLARDLLLHRRLRLYLALRLRLLDLGLGLRRRRLLDDGLGRGNRLRLALYLRRRGYELDAVDLELGQVVGQRDARPPHRQRGEHVRAHRENDSARRRPRRSPLYDRAQTRCAA